MFRKLLTACVLVAIVGLNLAVADPAQDKKALQGKWTMTKGGDTAAMTFDGDKFKLDLKGKSASGTFTLAAADKLAGMDLAIKEGSDEETKKYVGKTAKAIYKLEGDKLTWLASEPGSPDRPTAFPKEGENPKGLLLIFERAKK